jgi:hypothetical protein
MKCSRILLATFFVVPTALLVVLGLYLSGLDLSPLTKTELKRLHLVVRAVPLGMAGVFVGGLVLEYRKWYHGSGWLDSIESWSRARGLSQRGQSVGFWSLTFSVGLIGAIGMAELVGL